MRTLTAALLIGAFGLPGCVIVQSGVTNPIPGLTTVAVAPFVNLSAERSVDGRRFALAYHAELQKIPGYQVIPVGVTEQAIFDLGLGLLYNRSHDDSATLHLGTVPVTAALVVPLGPTRELRVTAGMGLGLGRFSDSSVGGGGLRVRAVGGAGGLAFVQRLREGGPDLLVAAAALVQAFMRTEELRAASSKPEADAGAEETDEDATDEVDRAPAVTTQVFSAEEVRAVAEAAPTRSRSRQDEIAKRVLATVVVVAVLAAIVLVAVWGLLR